MALILVFFCIFLLGVGLRVLQKALITYFEPRRIYNVTEVVYEYHVLLWQHGIYEELDDTLALPWEEIVPRPMRRSEAMLALARHWYEYAETSVDLEEGERSATYALLFIALNQVEDTERNSFLEETAKPLADVLKREHDPLISAITFGVLRKMSRQADLTSYL